MPKPQVASKKPAAVVASMRPDNMSQGGLADDFNGRIDRVRLVPWDYNGKMDHHVLASAVDFVPDEDSGLEPFTQHYSAGELEHFVPGNIDKHGNIEIVDLEADDPEEMEGTVAVKVGTRDQLNLNSNWGHFIAASIEAGFDVENITADVRCFEGVYGHFNRIPQKARAGMQGQESGGRQKTILVLTELLESEEPKVKAGAKGKAAASSKPATKGKAAAAADEDEDADDFDAKIVVAIAEALAEADEQTLPVSKLGGIALHAFSGPEKSPAMKRAKQPEFYASEDRPWVFDEETGTITLA